MLSEVILALLLKAKELFYLVFLSILSGMRNADGILPFMGYALMEGSSLLGHVLDP